MAPPTQDGEKELPSRVEAIRPCSCAYTTLSHQWGRRFTHSLTSVYVMILCVVGCVSKYAWCQGELFSFAT